MMSPLLAFLPDFLANDPLGLFLFVAVVSSIIFSLFILLCSIILP